MSKLKSRNLTVVLFLFYMIVLSSIILLKNQLAFSFMGLKFLLADPNIKRSVSLIPFNGMLILNGVPDYNEVILNALVFIPFGIFLCMLRKKKTFPNLILPVVLTSLLFEILQYVFVLGASDITDVLANTLGGILGIGIFFVVNTLCKEKVYLLVNTIALVLAIGFILLLSMVRPL